MSTIVLFVMGMFFCYVLGYSHGHRKRICEIERLEARGGGDLATLP